MPIQKKGFIRVHRLQSPADLFLLLSGACFGANSPRNPEA
jgi:hypothetical protein